MKTQSLNGRWQLRQAGATDSIPAIVPGDVHGALLKAKKIADPFYRDEELSTQWIGRTGWTYARTFTVSRSLLGRDRVLLRCEGLDSLATIRVNGRKVASTENMFRTWEFDVKKQLQVGKNEIEIDFAAPTAHVEKKMRKRRLPQWGGPMEQKGGNWLRKEPCNFGWDWGPNLVTCGIWRDISLIGFDVARLADVHILQRHAEKQVTLQISVAAERIDDVPLCATVTVSYKNKQVAAKTVSLSRNAAKVSLIIEDPQLWWPNGLGGQPLYDVCVELLNADSGQLDLQSRRIGLRTLRLDRHPDEWGESFQFAVNGVPFFAKGANWIPAEAILARLTAADYQRLVEDSAAANMNMLRVWGGGLYEDDAFYRACDENGICVWQDFIFSCATYPAFDDAFLANVRAEAEDNVRRLRHHPSIALWCGNNELEQGLVGDEWTERTMSWEDYGKLFDQLLPNVVKALDPERDYWPCSPHSPVGDRRQFNNPTCGDAHLWSVWHGQEPFEWYRTCEHRFNSEFGFQSFPEPKTVQAYTLPEDRNVTSYVMEHHQRSGIGNSTILRYMLDWFRLPTQFDMTLWLSQILQGMAMKYACEHWRRSMPRGMGTLYWQLNDCWPVASWASIDYYGRWKALHYMARNFFAPLLISGLEDAKKKSVEIHVTSDRLETLSGKVQWRLTTVAGKTLENGSKEIRIRPQANGRVQTLKLDEHVAEFGSRDLMLWLDLVVGGRTVSTNFATFARPKHMELREPGISAAVKQLGEDRFKVSLKTKHPALWTWLELTSVDLRCSDQFFHLRPGKTIAVEVTTSQPMTVAQFCKRLGIRSLIDTYR